MEKNKIFRLRLTEHDRLSIDELALRLNRSRSDAIRLIIRQAASRLLENFDRQVEELTPRISSR